MNYYSTVSPAEVGVMTGAVGSAMGYVLAPRKYNLEQIFTQKPDVFEKTFSPIVMKNAADSQKRAYETLALARKTLRNGGSENATNLKLAEYLRTPKYTNAYKTVKSILPKARVQTAIILGFISAMLGVMGKIIVGDKY